MCFEEIQNKLTSFEYYIRMGSWLHLCEWLAWVTTLPTIFFRYLPDLKINYICTKYNISWARTFDLNTLQENRQSIRRTIDSLLSTIFPTHDLPIAPWKYKLKRVKSQKDFQKLGLIVFIKLNIWQIFKFFSSAYGTILGHEKEKFNSIKLKLVFLYFFGILFLFKRRYRR